MKSPDNKISNVEAFFERVEKALTLEGFVDSISRRAKDGIENLSVTGKSLAGKNCQIREDGITQSIQKRIDQFSEYILSKLSHNKQVHTNSKVD